MHVNLSKLPTYSSVCRVFHKYTKLAMWAVLPTLLFPYIFFFFYLHQLMLANVKLEIKGHISWIKILLDVLIFNGIVHLKQSWHFYIAESLWKTLVGLSFCKLRALYRTLLTTIMFRLSHCLLITKQICWSVHLSWQDEICLCRIIIIIYKINAIFSL